MRIASMAMSSLFSLLLWTEAAAQMTRPLSAASLTPAAAVLNTALDSVLHTALDTALDTVLHTTVPTPPFTTTGTVTAEAEAAPGAGAPAARENKILLAAKARISAKQAAAKVKQKFGGKVLSIKLIESKGPPVYRVKTLSESGVVKVVFVDGHSGAVFE